MSVVSAQKAVKKDIDNILIRCLRTNSTWGNKFLPLGRKDSKGDYIFVLGSGKENRFVTLLGEPRPYDKEGKRTESYKYSMGISIESDQERKFIKDIDGKILEELNSKIIELLPDQRDLKDTFQNTLIEQTGYCPMMYVKYNVEQSKTHIWTSANREGNLVSHDEIKNGDKAMVILKLDRITIHKNRMKLDCVVVDIYINREETNSCL